MPQSLSYNLVHIVFSTKHRERWLRPEVRQELYPYLSQIARDVNCECYRVGGVEDHVHFAIRLSPSIHASKLVSTLKTGSFKWMNRKFKGFADFAWQEGYGLFSVSSKDLKPLLSYIENQEVHHLEISFEDEMRKFFALYDVEYDEKFAWG